MNRLLLLTGCLAVWCLSPEHASAFAPAANHGQASSVVMDHAQAGRKHGRLKISLCDVTALVASSAPRSVVELPLVEWDEEDPLPEACSPIIESSPKARVYLRQHVRESRPAPVAGRLVTSGYLPRAWTEESAVQTYLASSDLGRAPPSLS